MVNWSQAMQQTYEYFIVDPDTWMDQKQLDTVISSTINRDGGAETLGSLNFEIGEPIGECYIRVYLITIQNGIRERHPLGTFIIQTPSYSFDGKVKSVSIDAYTPLLELKEKKPPLGYSVLKDTNIMDTVYSLVRANARAPVTKTENSEVLHYDFVANVDDSYLNFIYDLVANAKYIPGLDELGRIIFQPKQELSTLQPIWTYDEGNSSILHPKIDVKHDLYGIPNVVEVIYSNGNDYFYSKVSNDDPNSPISTVNRGREILHRDTNPSGIGNPTQEQVDEYARLLLKGLSTLEYTITYTHGYCPVRLGDCVRLNYKKAGLINVKAKVISQSIECTPGCPVTETAVFTDSLWG